MDPLISILVPVYNVEKFVEKCLLSIMNQTYTNIEILVYDDASTDRSFDIIIEIQKKDPRIKVLNGLCNKGVSFVRNKLIQETKGAYFLFVDSDDYISNTMVEELYNKAFSTNADITICNLNFVFEKTGCEREQNNTFPTQDIVSREEAIGLFFRGIITGHCCNKLIKYKTFKENKLSFSEKLVAYDDAPGVFSILLCSDIITFVDAPLYHYLQRDNSITRETSIPILNAHLNLVSDLDKNLPIELLNNYQKEFEIFKVHQLFYNFTLQTKNKKQNSKEGREFFDEYKRLVESIRFTNAFFNKYMNWKDRIRLIVLKSNWMYGYRKLKKLSKIQINVKNVRGKFL